MQQMSPPPATAGLVYRWLQQEYHAFWMLGPDAADHLHRRSSNDVLRLNAGQGQGNAILERKAHLQALLSVQRLSSDALLLMTEAERSEVALAEIKRYQIMERFTLQQTGKASGTPYASLLLFGDALHALLNHEKALHRLEEKAPSLASRLPQALALASQGSLWLEAPDAENEKAYDEPVLLLKEPFLIMGRYPEGGILLLGPEAKLQTLMAALQEAAQAAGFSLNELSDAAWQTYQLEAGIPRYPQGWDETTLLPATALEHWTVSYTKGCYLGQETVARVKTYGSVPQLLMGLLFEADQPLARLQALEGQALQGSLSENAEAPKELGQLRQVGYSKALGRPIALAYLAKANRTPGQTLWLQVGESSVKATVTLLPFRQTEASQASKARLEGPMRLFLEGETEAALEALRQLIASNPRDYEAQETLGVLLGRLERYEEATAVMRQLLEQEPDWVMAYTNLSRFAIAQGDKEAAETYKAKATSISMKKAMQAAMAKKQAEGSSTASPQQAKETKAEQEAQRHQQLEDRIAMLQHALQFNEADPLAHFGLGSSYISLEQYAKAIPHLERVVALNPKQSQAYLLLGQAYEQTQARDKAQAIYEQGIAMASQRGDLQPLQTMQSRLAALTAVGA